MTGNPTERRTVTLSRGNGEWLVLVWAQTNPVDSATFHALLRGSDDSDSAAVEWTRTREPTREHVTTWLEGMVLDDESEPVSAVEAGILVEGFAEKWPDLLAGGS